MECIDVPKQHLDGFFWEAKKEGQHLLVANLSKTPENVLMMVVPAFEGQTVTLFLKKNPHF